MKKNFKSYVLILMFAIFSLGIAGIFSVLPQQKVSASENIPQATATASDSYFCLKDNNIFLTEDQSSFGLCWNFSMLATIESYLSMKTNQVYDFSEAWVAVCKKMYTRSYAIGGGGDYTNFINVVKKYGLLAESDLPYSALQNIDDSNYETIYELYKDKATKIFTNNLSANGFYLSGRTAIKNYLISKGACTISYDANFMVETDDCPYTYSYCNTINANSTGAHAITLIGWDDTISFTDKYGGTQTGAWICLNSWGTGTKNEIVYISYNDAWLVATIAGVNISYNFDYKLTSSTSNLTNKDVKRYKNGWTETTTGSFNQKNVFYYGDNISMTYSYYTDASVQVIIEKDGIDRTSEFSTVSVDTSQKKITIAGTDIDSGCYKVIFRVNGEDYINQLYVLSGADTVSVNTNASSSSDACLQGFNDIYSTKNTNTLYAFSTSNAGVMTINPATLSRISSVRAVNGSATIYVRSDSSFKASTGANYSVGTIILQYDGLNSYGKYDASVILTTTSGSQVTLNIIIYKYNYSQDTKTYAFYQNVENCQNPNSKYIVVGSNFTNTLLDASSASKNFAGWYLDAGLTIQLSSSMVTGLDITQASLTNYRDTNLSSNKKRAFIFVYAKFENAELYFENKNFTATYGDILSLAINPAQNGSGNYKYTALRLPNGLTFDQNTLRITGTILTTGTLNFQITVVDNSTGKGTDATFQLVVSKRKITYRIHNKQSVSGEQLEELTGEIVSGEVYGTDNLNIQLFCDATISSSAGDYEINGTWTNSNYIVTFQTGTYTITQSQIKATATGYSGVYDGTYHYPEIQIQRPATTSVMYGYNETDFTTSPIGVKDYTSKPVTIYIKFSAIGYEDLIIPVTISIEQKEVTLMWVSGTFVYNGKIQAPTCSISSGLVSGDTAQVTVSGGQVNAGQGYTATATINNPNYKIANSTLLFSIQKAQQVPDVTVIKLNANQVDNANTLSDIDLPEGFAWKDPSQEVKYGKNTCKATYTPADTANYETINLELTFTKSNPQDSSVKYVAIIVAIGFILAVVGIIIYKSVTRVKEKQLVTPAKHEKIKKITQDELIIEFVTNAPISLAPIKAPKRATIELPKLERKYYEFCGWYTDNLCLKPYVSNGANNKLVLYAKWRPKI